MPLEQPAMMLIVPVGAIVVTVALRTRAPPGASKMEPSKLGNTPRSRARSSLAARASSWMKLITSAAILQASSESYGTCSCSSMSAKPITPRPILRLPLVICSISGSG